MKPKRRATPSESKSGSGFAVNGNAKIARKVSSVNRSPQVVSGQRMKTTPPPIASSPRDTANITRNKVSMKGERLSSGKRGTSVLTTTSGKLGHKSLSRENFSKEGANPMGRSVAGRVKGTSDHGASANAENRRDFHKGNEEESDNSDERDENEADEIEESDDEDEEISLDHRSKSSRTVRDPMGKSGPKGLEEEGDDDNESDDEQDLDEEESEQDLQSFKQAFPGMSSDEDDEEDEGEDKMEEDDDNHHDGSDSDHEEEDDGEEDEEDGSGLMKASFSPLYRIGERFSFVEYCAGRA